MAKYSLFWAVIFFFACITAIRAQHPGSTPTKDQAFTTDAAEGGLGEVELGRLAAAKATDTDVRTFGQMMVDDHSKANDELRAIAKSKGLTFPSEPGTSQLGELAHLRTLSGANFDRTYIDLMVMDHKNDLADFRKEAQNGNNDAVKAFAQKMLPIIDKHLKRAMALQSEHK